MRAPVAFAFIVALVGAASASAATPVTLTPSSMSFKDAISSCAGALGSVSFTLGHARIASQAGVSDDTDTTSAGIDTVTFVGSGGKSAVVTVNAHDMTVSAKNMSKKGNQLVCVMPD